MSPPLTVVSPPLTVVSPPLPEEHRCGRISGSIYKVHVNIQSTVGKTGFGWERSTREDGGVRVDFRSAELSKVNDDGEGSSSRGGKGQDLGMPQAYAQCKASRESELKKRAIETSAVPNFGCEGGEGLKPLGSFSAHPEGMKTCFVGSRVQKGGKLSNQNLATSFDPASLKCIACPTEHDILDKNKPFCVCVADQCFISNLSGGGGGHMYCCGENRRGKTGGTGRHDYRNL